LILYFCSEIKKNPQIELRKIYFCDFINNKISPIWKISAPILSNLSQQGFQQLQQFAEQVTIPSLITQMDIKKMKQHFTREIISHQYIARAKNGDAEALLSQIIQVIIAICSKNSIFSNQQEVSFYFSIV